MGMYREAFPNFLDTGPSPLGEHSGLHVPGSTFG